MKKQKPCVTYQKIFLRNLSLVNDTKWDIYSTFLMIILHKTQMVVMDEIKFISGFDDNRKLVDLDDNCIEFGIQLWSNELRVCCISPGSMTIIIFLWQFQPWWFFFWVHKVNHCHICDREPHQKHKPQYSWFEFHLQIFETQDNFQTWKTNTLVLPFICDFFTWLFL